MAIGTPTLLKEYTIDSTGQSSIGLTLPAGASAAAGDLVVVCYGFGKGSTPTITCADTQSNTYQLDVQADKTTNQTPHSGIFSSVLDTALSEGDTITVSFSASVNYPLAGAYVVTGIAASSWKDQASSGTGQSTSPSSGNVTTTQADELLVGVTVTGTPKTLSYGSGWTRLGTHVLNTTKAQDVGYAIKSSTGTYVFDGSITSADWASCIATYKGASTATTVTGVAAGAVASAVSAIPLLTVTGVFSAAVASTVVPTLSYDFLVAGTVAGAAASAVSPVPAITVTGTSAGAVASSPTHVPGVTVVASAAGSVATSDLASASVSVRPVSAAAAAGAVAPTVSAGTAVTVVATVAAAVASCPTHIPALAVTAIAAAIAATGTHVAQAVFNATVVATIAGAVAGTGSFCVNNPVVLDLATGSLSLSALSAGSLTGSGLTVGSLSLTGEDAGSLSLTGEDAGSLSVSALTSCD